MPISISATVLALRHSWGRYGSRTTPACLCDSIANAGPTRRRSFILLSACSPPAPLPARISSLRGASEGPPPGAAGPGDGGRPRRAGQGRCETAAVPDPISSGVDPTGAVSRGMRTLLARRDGRAGRRGVAGGVEDRVQRPRHPAALRPGRPRRRLPDRHGADGRRRHRGGVRLDRPRRRGRGGHPRRRRGRRGGSGPGPRAGRPRPAPSTTSRRSWPATSSSAASSSAPRCPASTRGRSAPP